MTQRPTTRDTLKTVPDMLSSSPRSSPPSTGESSSLDQQEISCQGPPAPVYREERLRRLDPQFVDDSRKTFTSAFGWDRRRSERYEACRTRAFFYQHRDDLTVKVAANTCKNRWCPICSTARSLRIASALDQWLKPAHDPKFITFTMAHRDVGLRSQITAIKTYFRTLRKSIFWRSRSQGGVWFFQVTYNEKSGQWHPHLHVVADTVYMPQKALSDLWHAITKDSYIVDIRTLTDHKQACRYAARYSARAANISYFPDEKKTEYAREIDHLHTFGTFGTAYMSTLFKVTKLEKGTWLPIGTWSDVVTQLETNPLALAVYHAWRTGDALQTPVTIDSRALFEAIATTTHDTS